MKLTALILGTTYRTRKKFIIANNECVSLLWTFHMIMPKFKEREKKRVRELELLIDDPLNEMSSRMYANGLLITIQESLIIP